MCPDVERRCAAIEALSDPWMLADDEWSVELVAVIRQEMLAESSPAGSVAWQLRV